MRIILRPWNSLQIALCHQLTHKDRCPSLNALTTIVGERHILFTESDAVTENTEDSTRSHDIAIEAFFLEVSIERNEK